MKPNTRSTPVNMAHPDQTEEMRTTQNLTLTKKATNPYPKTTSVAALRWVATLKPKQVASFTEIRKCGDFSNKYAVFVCFHDNSVLHL